MKRTHNNIERIIGQGNKYIVSRKVRVKMNEGILGRKIV